MAKSFQFPSRLLTALWILAVPTARSEIRLDKLTACSDIERVYLALKARPSVSPSDCRPPQDRLEAMLVGRTASNLCFLRTPPAAFLNSFSCVRFNSRSPTGAADVTCFRAAALPDIRAYKENYAERFAKLESNYLAAAEKCSISAGDSSNSSMSTFPPLASMLARFELGFITSLGTGRPSDSLIFHGYGETDPAIGTSGPTALEVVQVIVNSPVRRSVPAAVRRVGDWVLEVADTATVERDGNEQFARAGVPVRYSINIYNILREGPHTMSVSEKQALTSSLHDSIASELRADGFSEIPESQLKRQTGKSKDELFREITETFSFRGDPHQKLAPSFRILFKDTELQCTRRDRGAVGASLTGMQPIEGVQKTFGSIIFGVYGLGACSVSAEALSYAKDLLNQATEDIVDALDRK